MGLELGRRVVIEDGVTDENLGKVRCVFCLRHIVNLRCQIKRRFGRLRGSEASMVDEFMLDDESSNVCCYLVLPCPEKKEISGPEGRQVDQFFCLHPVVQVNVSES